MMDLGDARVRWWILEQTMTLKEWFVCSVASGRFVTSVSCINATLSQNVL